MDDHLELKSRGGKKACLSPKTVEILNKLCVQTRNGPLMTASCCWPHLSGWNGRSQRAANLLWSRWGGVKHSFHGQLDLGLIPTGPHEQKSHCPCLTGATDDTRRRRPSPRSPAAVMNGPKLLSITPQVRRHGDNGNWPVRCRPSAFFATIWSN